MLEVRFAARPTTEGFGHPRDTGATWTRIVDAVRIALNNWPTGTENHE